MYDNVDVDMVVKVLKQTAFSPWYSNGHAIHPLTLIQARISRVSFPYSTFFMPEGY
jgi:hypothetical protein